MRRPTRAICNFIETLSPRRGRTIASLVEFFETVTDTPAWPWMIAAMLLGSAYGFLLFLMLDCVFGSGWACQYIQYRP